MSTQDETCAGTCAPESGACTGALCGDGIVQASNAEACDLGPANSATAYGAGKCTDKCQPAPRCGDGKTDATELCDDAKNDGTPGSCSPDCKAHVALVSCGDGAVQAPEQCDYGSAKNGTATSKCDANCKLKCGNGAVEPGEQCDDGAANNTGAYGKCKTDCTLGPRCGDGAKNGTEQCDTGASNGTGSSNCDAHCKNKCGNGTVDPGEQCDDGTNGGTYGGCNANCTKAAYCGDGVKNGSEACDDGAARNVGAYGGCNANCTKAAYCGDGVKNGAEACDLGSANAANPYGPNTCSIACKVGSYCGDGVKNGAEVCDDGNGVSGDRCSSCKTELPLFERFLVLAGGTPTQAAGISGDGATVALSSSVNAMRWSASGGPVNYPSPEDCTSYARGISRDGKSIIAMVKCGTEIQSTSYVWSGSVTTPLAVLPGSFFGDVSAINGDGTVIVGTPVIGGRSRACRWVGGGAPQALSPSAVAVSASGVSSDGSIVVGLFNETEAEASAGYQWTASSGIARLEPIRTDALTNAFGISSDGKAVVGSSGGLAVRWVSGHPASLGSVGDALVANQDGSVIAGRGDGVFVWDAAHGARSLRALLVALGTDPGDFLREPTGMSEDGKIIVGNGSDATGADGWIVRLP